MDGNGVAPCVGKSGMSWFGAEIDGPELAADFGGSAVDDVEETDEGSGWKASIFQTSWKIRTWLVFGGAG